MLKHFRQIFGRLCHEFLIVFHDNQSAFLPETIMKPAGHKAEDYSYNLPHNEQYKFPMRSMKGHPQFEQQYFQPLRTSRSLLHPEHRIPRGYQHAYFVEQEGQLGSYQQGQLYGVELEG
jgi:hypothetical protein